MTHTLKDLARDTRGAGVLEYCLLCGLVAIAVIAAYRTFGTNISTKVEEQAGTVQSLPGSE